MAPASKIPAGRPPPGEIPNLPFLKNKMRNGGSDHFGSQKEVANLDQNWNSKVHQIGGQVCDFLLGPKMSRSSKNSFRISKLAKMELWSTTLPKSRNGRPTCHRPWPERKRTGNLFFYVCDKFATLLTEQPRPETPRAPKFGTRKHLPRWKFNLTTENTQHCCIHIAPPFPPP